MYGLSIKKPQDVVAALCSIHILLLLNLIVWEKFILHFRIHTHFHADRLDDGYPQQTFLGKIPLASFALGR